MAAVIADRALRAEAARGSDHRVNRSPAVAIAGEGRVDGLVRRDRSRLIATGEPVHYPQVLCVGQVFDEPQQGSAAGNRGLASRRSGYPRNFAYQRLTLILQQRHKDLTIITERSGWLLIWHPFIVRSRLDRPQLYGCLLRQPRRERRVDVGPERPLKSLPLSQTRLHAIE